MYESICCNVEKLKLQDDEAQIRINTIENQNKYNSSNCWCKIIHNKIDLFLKIIYLFFNLLSEKDFQFKFIVYFFFISFYFFYFNIF